MSLPNANELNNKLTEAINRLARVEMQQSKLETDLNRIQQNSEASNDDVRTSYVTKEELRLQMDNLKLTIDMLKTSIMDLAGRMGGLETNIVKRVEDIAKKQQEDQQASMKRIITIQGTILLGILASILGVLIPLFFHH